MVGGRAWRGTCPTVTDSGVGAHEPLTLLSDPDGQAAEGPTGVRPDVRRGRTGASLASGVKIPKKGCRVAGGKKGRWFAALPCKNCKCDSCATDIGLGPLGQS